KALNPSVTFKELQKIISYDPPLTARVLKTANSVYYGRRTPAKSIEDAIFTIGLNDLSSICLSTSVIESFVHYDQRLLDRRTLWKHSISTGALFESLAKRNNLDKSFNYLLAGLLHDIGWMILDHVAPEILGLALQSAEAREWSNVVEKKLFGLHHSEIGAIVLEQWNIPPEIIPIVLNHHAPEKADDYQKPAKFLQLASLLSPYKLPLITIESEITLDKSLGLNLPKKEITLDKLRKHYKKEITYAEDITELSLGWL
ncbi:MAG: HDOD domain-containing protein, partial [Candidatus Electryonea clarkiae]|nr:HDOD domain-containing protein [Candidatus Electryonea clarkiae]